MWTSRTVAGGGKNQDLVDAQYFNSRDTLYRNASTVLYGPVRVRLSNLPSMAVTMSVDGGSSPPPENVSDYNSYDRPTSQSPPPPESRQSLAPTALSPAPLPDSLIHTPAPVPENRPQGPYRPNYKPDLILSGHSRSISSVKFSPDGSMLASCGE